MKILVIHGPNLNLLDKREASHYGSLNAETIVSMLQLKYPEVVFDYFQSNGEGELILAIQEADEKYQGVIINPGGYSHTSVAIRDALELCRIPKVEVHLSNIYNREVFRQTLITAGACDAVISGAKVFSYIAAATIIRDMHGSKL